MDDDALVLEDDRNQLWPRERRGREASKQTSVSSSA